MSWFLFLYFLFITGCGAGIVSNVLQSHGNLNGDETGADGSETASSSQEELLIFVVNVGQGDATLVLGPEVNGDRVSLLIDAGRLDPDGGLILSELLEEQGVTELDYLIVTHFDADHMGGLVHAYGSTSLIWDKGCAPQVYFPTQAIIDLGESDRTTESVAEYLNCRDATQEFLSEGYVVVGQKPHENISYGIALGGDYSAKIVAGNGYVIGREERVENVDTENEKSIAVLISNPDGFFFLVTGDLTGQAYGDEDAKVEIALGHAVMEISGAISVLRAGHHGSASASAPEFLQAIAPQVSIISVGDNAYGHPHCQTLKVLAENSELVVQTEEGSPSGTCATGAVIAGGTVLIRVQGDVYTVLSAGRRDFLEGGVEFEVTCHAGVGCE